MRHSISVFSTITAITIAALSSAMAAEISLESFRPGEPSIIDIKGDITWGDADRFYELAGSVEKAIVFLESPGGLVEEGLSIGAEIAQRGFTTIVAPNAQCYSICAVIWVSGEKRFMDRSSIIGVHAAYRDEAMKDGSTLSVESGRANAEIGSYLTHIGLSREAIRYFTTKGPDDFLPVTPEWAQRLDIDVAITSPDEIEWEKDRPTPRSIARQAVTYVGMSGDCAPLFNINPGYLQEQGEQRLKLGHEIFGGEIFAELLPEFTARVKSTRDEMGIKNWCMAAASDLMQENLPTGIDGPGFDCAKASTSTERAICGSPNLWLEDRALSSIYTMLRQAGTPEEKKTLARRQRDWIRQREACGADAACIADRYQAWILDLSLLGARAG